MKKKERKLQKNRPTKKKSINKEKENIHIKSYQIKKISKNKYQVNKIIIKYTNNNKGKGKGKGRKGRKQNFKKGRIGVLWKDKILRNPLP